MRRYTCFTSAKLTVGSEIVLDGAESAHLCRVRRAEAGERVLLIDGRGGAAEASLLVPDKRWAVVRVEEAVPGGALSEPLPLAIAPAAPRSDAFDDMVARCTELGVSAFFPLEAEHCVLRLAGERAGQRVEKWRRTALESLKQCERLWLPEFHGPWRVGEFLERAPALGWQPVALVERTAGALPHLATLLDTRSFPRPVLVVGPEGGWSSDEKSLFDSTGIARAHLGPAVLRAETSCLAAVSLAVARIEVIRSKE